MSKVFTMGEALIDFIPDRKGVELKEVESFKKAAGGAPANVACAVARLGGKSGFIGKLGADPFGDFLVDILRSEGVDLQHLIQTKEANTALAFVSLKADGNRDFSFYRNPSADMLLHESEIGDDWFKSDDILHFCSVDLIEAPVKYAQKRALENAKAAGALISFDPNVRLPLWPDAESCRQAILAFLPYADVVKISDEELEFITGIKDEAAAVQSLFVGDVKHVIYTLGPNGAVWVTKEFSVNVPGLKVNAIDTTGAGDAFIGSLLYQIAQEPQLIRSGITEQQALSMLTFSNKAAAITTTRNGAIASLPTIQEIQ